MNLSALGKTREYLLSFDIHVILTTNSIGLIRLIKYTLLVGTQ